MPSSNPKTIVTEQYLKYRKITFSMTPDKVGFKVMQPRAVYGVNMDLGVLDIQQNAKFFFTTTAFVNGEAAFMPSPGGGTMGLGRFPAVAEVAKSIVALGQTFVTKARSVDDIPLPDVGVVTFYFFTVTGGYFLSDTLASIQKGPYYPMVLKFGQIRKVAETMLDERKK